MSSNKRAPQPSRPHGAPLREEEILKADDPRRQLVAQYPVKRGPRKSAEEAIPTGIFDTEKHDEELRASYGADAEFGYKPVFIYVERGPGQGQLVQLRQGALVVGRASISELRLQHPSISRRHAQITRIGEQFYVKDLGSQNGTFVNKQRLATEIEIFPGDQLAMGNAMMKLRGPLKKGEQEIKPLPMKMRTTSSPELTMAQTSIRQTGIPKVAIFAGAVGFGLAAVLAIALVKLPSGGASNERSTGSKASKHEETEIVADDVKTKVINDAIAKRMNEHVSSAPREETRPEGLPKQFTVASLSHNNEREQREAPVAAPSKESSSGGTSHKAILAAYEKGEIEDAQNAAMKAGDKDLSDKIGKFARTYDAANTAFVDNNGTAALKGYEQAIKLDESITNGMPSKKGAEVKAKLSKLYAMMGGLYLKNGAEDDARNAFQNAVKYDSSNGAALAQLRKLGGDADDEKPRAKKASSKAAADDAFGDEDEKPAKKSKKVAKSRAQAIDDAFGD